MMLAAEIGDYISMVAVTALLVASGLPIRMGLWRRAAMMSLAPLLILPGYRAAARSRSPGSHAAAELGCIGPLAIILAPIIGLRGRLESRAQRRKWVNRGHRSGAVCSRSCTDVTTMLAEGLPFG